MAHLKSSEPLFALRGKLLGLITALGVIVSLAIAYVSSVSLGGADEPTCRSIYMYPSYARVAGFDTTHTKFASKYNLFLYREQGKDKVPDESGPTGIPVLFIPGNAGSFKQVRSIASEASNKFYDNHENGYYKNKNFDFYAVHFNEDFTAFHGRTMLDQAEYSNEAIRFILSLYKNQAVPPSSVILIGHSMGGVVSRVMLTLPNYLNDSVNTIITLAAPHAAAPATFDSDIMNIYAATDIFWRAGFSKTQHANVPQSRLNQVSLISITGGSLDTTLPADYTTLAGLVPHANGFTTYTTGIPGVWTPIDHLAIVWCDQLRKVIVASLFDVVEPSKPQKTKSLNDRITVFKKHFLPGFEDIPLQIKDFSFELSLNENHTIHHTKSRSSSVAAGDYFLISTKDTKFPTFNLLTSSKVEAYDREGEASFLLGCNGVVSDIESEVLSCHDLIQHVTTIPNFAHHSASDSSVAAEFPPYYASQLPPDLTQNYTYIVYREPNAQSGAHFASFEMKSSLSSKAIIRSSLFQLLFGSTTQVSLDSKVIDLIIPNSWSSLISYNVKVDGANKSSSSILRQWVTNPFETKWHLNLDDRLPKKVAVHGIAPYTPFETKKNPLNLQIWSVDPSDFTIHIKINILDSLRQLILRYRLGAIAFPIYIVVSTLIIQLHIFFESGVYPTFDEGLKRLTNRYLVLNIIFVSFLTFILKLPFISWLAYLLDPIGQATPNKLSKAFVNPYFLGLEEQQLWILGPVLYILSLTLVNIIYLIIRLILVFIQHLNKSIQKFRSPNSSVSNSIFSKTSISGFSSQKFTEKRRFTGAIILAVFVMFYIPYQFAYIVCAIVQILVTVKSHIEPYHSEDEQQLYQKSFESPGSNDYDDIKLHKIQIKKNNFANFNFSLMMLMIWLIPVNLPVLIVFFHNAAVRWETPFSSHHNILAVLPIILLIGRNVQGKFVLSSPTPYLQSPSSSSTQINIVNGSKSVNVQKRITTSFLTYFALSALIYGIRHLYWLHHLINIFCAWLFVLSFWKT